MVSSTEAAAVVVPWSMVSSLSMDSHTLSTTGGGGENDTAVVDDAVLYGSGRTSPTFFFYFSRWRSDVRVGVAAAAGGEVARTSLVLVRFDDLVPAMLLGRVAALGVCGGNDALRVRLV